MGSSTADDVLISNINQKLLQAYRAEEEFWKQRSRQLWLALGDQNTAFFHASTKGRRARKRISVIENSAGIPVYEDDKIVEVISSYFQDIFTSSNPDPSDIIIRALTPCISEAMNNSLTGLPSPLEIKEALFAIHPDKAPGPDGFSASFFQTNWDLVKPALVHEIRGFFSSGCLPDKINATHVRLIPKIHAPKSVADYRLIALCNIYYIVISKLLSIRLKPILQDSISENQSAFIPGRAISDNVLITHEVLHYLKISAAEIHCTMAVKTDISKAYDRLEWSFIKRVLERMGFCEVWISWVMQCITTVSYSFLVDNTAVGTITPQRGIRQGDPLSPYIFILCGEVLSGLCKKAQQEGTLAGIRVSNHSPRINHLLFADDTMFFTKTNPLCCATPLQILQDYEYASGQKINSAKSSISFSSKTPQEVRLMVKLQLGIDKEGGVEKYLGLPEHFGRKKKDLFSSIVDRMKQKAVSWSSRYLSTAGKMTMLQSVISPIPTFAMSCFELPKILCKKIQSVLTRFWWDDNKGNKKFDGSLGIS